MANISSSETRQQARALLDSRVKFVTALVKTRQCVTDLKEQLVEAVFENKRVCVCAIKEGWRQDELKKLALDLRVSAVRRNRVVRNDLPSRVETTVVDTAH